MSIITSCHCGNVKITFNDTPEWLTKCNCSICSKLGAIWAHSEIDNISIDMSENSTLRYIRGEGIIAFHSCKKCGCTTHWENLQKPNVETGEGINMAVNMQLLEPKNLNNFRIRNFDGADSWSYLD